MAIRESIRDLKEIQYNEKKKTEKMLLKKTVKYHLMIHLFRCL